MMTSKTNQFDYNSKPQRWIVLSAIALLVTTLTGATVQADGEARAWSWSRDAATIEAIHIDIIRGTVEIMETLETEVRITATVEGSRQVWSADLKLNYEGASLTIKDHYAVKLPIWLHKECLPPTGERGDFWHTDARFKIVISAPSNIDIRTTIADQFNTSP